MGLEEPAGHRSIPSVNNCLFAHEFIYNYKVCLWQSPTVRGRIPFDGFLICKKEAKNVQIIIRSSYSKTLAAIRPAKVFLSSAAVSGQYM